MKEINDNGKAIIEINNFSLQLCKFYTDPVEICGRKWRVYLFPRGNGCDNLSVYLDYVSYRHKGRYDAHFSIEALDRLDPTISVKREADHRFDKHETDWGFTNFLSLATLKYQKGLLLHDKLVLSVQVGLRGHRNAGLKCEWDDSYCLNALLYSLYHLPALRRAVYQLPINGEEASQNFTTALQRVFYRLEFGRASVGTKALRESLGDLECLKRSNFKQLARVVLDRLIESELVVAKDDIQRWFQWRTENQTKGMDVNFESTYLDTHLDISLNMQGRGDLIGGFRTFVKDNSKHSVDGQGGVTKKSFLSLPPILLAYIKGGPRRVRNPPEDVDLSEFTDSPSQYSLYCVIGCSKEVYYPIIRVGSHTVYQRLLMNFNTPCIPYRSLVYGSIHALIYLRTADLPWLLSPFPKIQIPEVLRTMLDREAAVRELKEVAEKQLVSLNVVASYLRHAQGQDGFTLAFRRKLKYKVPRMSSIHEIKPQLAAQFALAPALQGFWCCIEDPPNTLSITFPLIAKDEQKPIHTLAGCNQRFCLLLVPSSTPFHAGDIIVFFQFYDPHLETLRDAGHAVVRAAFTSSTKLADLVPLMNSFIHQPPSSPLDVYLGQSHLDPLPRHPNCKLNIQNGEILVFQRPLEFNEMSTLRFPSAPDYYRHLSWLVPGSA